MMIVELYVFLLLQNKKQDSIDLESQNNILQFLMS